MMQDNSSLSSSARPGGTSGVRDSLQRHSSMAKQQLAVLLHQQRRLHQDSTTSGATSTSGTSFADVMSGQTVVIFLACIGAACIIPLLLWLAAVLWRKWNQHHKALQHGIGADNDPDDSNGSRQRGKSGVDAGGDGCGRLKAKASTWVLWRRGLDAQGRPAMAALDTILDSSAHSGKWLQLHSIIASSAPQPLYTIHAMHCISIAIFAHYACPYRWQSASAAQSFSTSCVR